MALDFAASWPRHATENIGALFGRVHVRCAQVAANEAVGSKSIKFWNASTGAEERTIALSESQLTQFELSTDGNFVTGTGFGNVSLWDVATGMQLWSVDHTTSTSTVLLSAATGPDWRASVEFSLQSSQHQGWPRARRRGRHRNRATLRVVNPDGRVLAPGEARSATRRMVAAPRLGHQTGRLVFELLALRTAVYSPRTNNCPLPPVGSTGPPNLRHQTKNQTKENLARG